MMAYPETAQHLNALADSILNIQSTTLPKAERELIASYVSNLNECVFCSESHGAVADVHSAKPGFARDVWNNPEAANLSDRLKSLLKIAKKVQSNARSVTEADVEHARKLGATDADIHDTVLIAAAFCMFNRYVDGLGTFAPPRKDPAYVEMGHMLADRGYKNAIPK
jgi:uncharacterized peroxidase-related enzyme